MSARINPTTLMDAQSTAGAGNWFDIDYVADSGQSTRSFAGTLTSGDTVNIDVALDAAKVITVAQAFTSTSFNGTVAYPIFAIRARKTGTAGPATVIGMV